MPTLHNATYLVADIGATHARFQLASDQGLADQAIVLSTADYTQAMDILAVVASKLELNQLERALIAVAGPALADAAGEVVEIEITNIKLRFEKAECEAFLGCQVELANDFYATAWGVPYAGSLTQVGGKSIQQNRHLDFAQRHNRAVMGPGSGLGMATIVPTGRTGADSKLDLNLDLTSSRAVASSYRVIASEGGHADLAPGSPLEAELWNILHQTEGHVSWETVLSGPGLVNLYGAMSQVWGAQAETLSPSEISQRGVSMQDPVCHQTLESFCSLLGSAAGNFALVNTALGGVYIAGGIVPQMVDFVSTSPLRRRFEERGPMTDMVRDIPIFIVMDSNAGLNGAYYCLKNSK